MRFSVIIPVYNRPNEIKELLESLTLQTNKNFEVLIVEDGSSLTCEDVVCKFKKELDVKYYYKENSGPGLSRNYGVEKASESFYVFLDSDCLIPEEYFSILTFFYTHEPFECFGGVDKAHNSFTAVQKSINYSMTSFLTTGGLRGGKKKITRFYPRSFNMGFSKMVFEATKGYSGMRFGEDIDLSIRIEKAGYKAVLLNELFVYHKRRVDFKKFFKQIFNSGIARINLFKLHPDSLKLTHFFPIFFVFFFLISILLSLIINPLCLLPLFIYLSLIFIDSSLQIRSLKIGVLSVFASLIQLFAYGTGFAKAIWVRLVLNRKEFNSFTRNFYE